MKDSDPEPESPESSDESAARAAMLAEIRRDFGAITEKHRARVVALCRRIVGNDQLAQDVAQDAFALAYQKLDTFEGRSTISTWLFGIARLTAMGVVRRKQEALTDDGIVDLSDPGVSTLKELGREERDALIRAAAEACLEPLEQEIAHLRYVENLPRERIGAMLGLGDAEAVRAHLVRIKRRMQKAVRERLVLLGHGTSFLRTRW